MFKWFSVTLLALFLLSFNVSAKNSDNPFAKNDLLTVGKNITWKIDKNAGHATKSSTSNNGTYYHLQFDNKQLKLMITSDATGASPKNFSQLEIEDLKIDGKQSSLFMWCLNNQERHNRFLQQGLSVKKNVCAINGAAGTFIMRLNKDTLVALQQGSKLSIMLKPFRTPLELTYEISDFNDMYQTLNAKPEAVASPVIVTAPVAVSSKAPVAKAKKKCLANPPVEYKNIKPVEYNCDDANAKIGAERQVTNLIDQEKANKQKLALEREKQLKLAEENKQKALAEKLKQDELLQAEAAAIAASEVKQAEIGDEITQKMLSMCEKYWEKGQHRCYCEKYIEHAPSEIQASSTCK